MVNAASRTMGSAMTRMSIRTSPVVARFRARDAHSETILTDWSVSHGSDRETDQVREIHVETRTGAVAPTSDPARPTSFRIFYETGGARS